MVKVMASSSNADFKLLCESLGFYNAEAIRDYFMDIELEVGINLRPIQYWLNGKQAGETLVPADIIQHFESLELKKFQMAQDDFFINNDFLFKEKHVMWHVFPQLKGLPCTFLNQLMIQVQSIHGRKAMSYFQYKSTSV